jgi:mannosyltransferase
VSAVATAPSISIGRIRVRREAGLPMLFGFGALLVSIAGAWIPSASPDEAASASAIGRSLPDLLRMTTHVDAVHALYYVALHSWTSAFGMSPLSLRALSAIGVGVGAAGVVQLAQMMRGTRFGVLAGVVYVSIPLATWTATEARSYAWVIATTTWATVSFVSALREGGGRRWLAYAVMVALVTVLFIDSSLVVLTQLASLWVLGPSRRRRIAGTLAGAAGLAVAAPLVLLSYGQRAQVNWIGPFTPEMARSAALQWFGDAQPYATIAWCLVLMAIYGSAKGIRRAARLGGGDVSWLVLVLIAPCALFPTAALLIATAGGVPLYVPRYSAMSVGALALLIAYGVSLLGRRAPLAVALLLVLCAPTFIAQRAPLANGNDWGNTAAVVKRMAKPGDSFYFAQTGATSWPRYMLPFYRDDFAGLKDMAQVESAAQAGSLIDAVAPAGDAIAGSHVPKTVIVIADNLAPWWHSTDADVFEKAGYTVASSVMGSNTTVVLLHHP